MHQRNMPSLFRKKRSNEQPLFVFNGPVTINNNSKPKSKSKSKPKPKPKPKKGYTAF
jgi:hypothetical protein